MMTNDKYTRLVKLQKAFFNEHITREIPFRLCALDRLAEALVSREKQFCEALHADLGKSAFESYATEIGFLLHEIRTTKNHLQSWARDRRRPDAALRLAGAKPCALRTAGRGARRRAVELPAAISFISPYRSHNGR